VPVWRWQPEVGCRGPVKKKDDGAGESVNEDRPFKSSSPVAVERVESPINALSEPLISDTSDSALSESSGYDESGWPGEVGELETVITQNVKEKEANLDERTMKVATRDHVPYRFPQSTFWRKGRRTTGRLTGPILMPAATSCLRSLPYTRLK